MPFLRITTIFLLLPAAIFLGMTESANAQSLGTPGVQSGSRAGQRTANCSTSTAQNCTVAKMRARGAAASSSNAVKPEAQDLETGSILVTPNAQTLLAGVVEIDTTTCAFITSGSWQVTTPPKYGTVQTAIMNAVGPSCTAYTYPFNFIFYTWTSTDPAGTTDTFSATWSGDSQTTPEPFTFDFTLACPTPTIASISPNVWTAGQSYLITITGQNFVTAAAAATTNCPVSTVAVQTPDTNPDVTVAVSGITVVSATQITATVEATSAPNTGPPLKGGTPAPAGAIAATVEVIATPPAQSGPAPAVSAKVVALDAATAPAPNVDVLLASQIIWSGNVISGGAATQPIVVGQQIVLTATPTDATLEDLPVYLTLSPTPTWTVPSTNIAGWSPSTEPTTAPTPTVLTGPSLSTYFVVSGNAIPVTYESCVQGQTASPIYDQCTTATATFNVTGPTDVTVYTCGGVNPAVTCTGTGQLGDVVVKAGPRLGFGTSSDIGIIFTISASAAPQGTYSFVQLISSHNTSYDLSSGTVCPDNIGSGLDNSYPYGNATSVSTDDNPSNPLFADDKEVTTSFAATMYAMWTPSDVSNPLPVPLGYVTWGYSGDAIQNLSTAVWSINPNTTSKGTAGSFVPSSTYPTWTTTIVNAPNPCS